MASSRRPLVVAALVVVVGLAGAASVGRFAMTFRETLELARPPVATVEPVLAAPTPRLSRRVVLVIVDGLRLDTSRGLPWLDALRRRGIAGEASAAYPTWSRPGQVAMLTGVPPTASGVRTNRHPTPVVLDSIMHRVRAGGLRVAVASDLGTFAPLFLEPADVELLDLVYAIDDGRVRVPAGHRWPFDDVRKTTGPRSRPRSPSLLAATPSSSSC